MRSGAAHCRTRLRHTGAQTMALPRLRVGRPVCRATQPPGAASHKGSFRRRRTSLRCGRRLRGFCFRGGFPAMAAYAGSRARTRRPGRWPLYCVSTLPNGTCPDSGSHSLSRDPFPTAGSKFPRSRFSSLPECFTETSWPHPALPCPRHAVYQAASVCRRSKGSLCAVVRHHASARCRGGAAWKAGLRVQRTTPPTLTDG